MQELRRTQRKRRVVVSGVILVLFVAALGVLSRLDILAIRGVVVENETSVPTGKIEALVRGELRGAYALLVMKQTSLLYPKRTIRKALTEAFPEIGAVEFTMHVGRILALRVSSRERRALWCGEHDDGVHTEVDTCFFFDAEGLIFAPAIGGATSTTHVRYYGSLMDASHGTSTPLGGRFLTSAALVEIETLRTLLRRDLSLTTIALSIVDHDVLVRLGSGTELYFSRRAAFDVAVENLATLVASRAGTSTAERMRALDGLEYVDMRFGNRLYYR